ncbi:Oryzain alpha chain [Balamuthia mandrillaris]
MSRLLFWCTALFASPFLWPNTNPETSNKLYYPALTESIMLLCWALDNGLDNQEYVSCLIAEKGHLELLKQAHCKGFPVNMTTLNLAENGQFEVLKWAQEGRYMLLNRHLFSSAAKGGHLDILKWLKDLGCRIEANEACGYAAEHGHLEMLCWLFEARADCELSADLCAKAAANGHLDVLKWLREKGFAWDEYTCLYAAKSRHFGGSKIRHKAWMSRARRSRAWAYINEHEEVWEWILELMH